MIDAFPLHWPAGYKRTTSRIKSQFKQTMEKAQRFLHTEVERLGGRELIVSTDIPIRNDGKLYTDWMRRKIDDPGVAIYFKYKSKDISMCCDQYQTIWENIYALGKGIEALRGMERWGVSDFLERAFTGFAALPPSSNDKHWYEVLGVEPTAGRAQIKDAYILKAKEHHPDRGGNPTDFDRVKKAYDYALSLKD